MVYFYRRYWVLALLLFSTSFVQAEYRTEKIDLLALEASAAVYRLPDLEQVQSGRDLVTQFRMFVSSTPENYEIHYASSDPETGLKFAVYSPAPELGSDPWVIALAGTQSITDWLAQQGFGRAQFDRLDPVLEKFSSKPTQTRPIMITGHGIGGGLAQAFSSLLQQNSPGLKLELVTWNAFGAKELIQNLAAYDPKALDKINSRNFYVSGDPISKIGTFFGKSFRLEAPTPEIYDPENGSKRSSVTWPIRLHSVEMLNWVAQRPKPYGLAHATPEAPQQIKTLTGLLGVVKSTQHLPAKTDPLRFEAFRKLLMEALEVSQTSLAASGSYTPRVLAYLLTLSQDLGRRLAKGPEDYQALEELRKAIEEAYRRRS